MIEQIITGVLFVLVFVSGFLFRHYLPEFITEMAEKKPKRVRKPKKLGTDVMELKSDE